MMGALGGMFVATGAGLLLEFTGSYVPLFIIASVAYLLALAVVHSLAPRLAPLVIAENQPQQ
jgi:ACS family hexuronate transporter-like MFS transporter